MLVQFQPANKKASTVQQTGRFKGGKNRPAFNTIIKDNGWAIEVALPGSDKSDVEILIRDRHLIVKNNQQVAVKENEPTSYLRREFNVTPFELYFQIPENALSEAIQATFEAGILYLTIPRRLPHKINVK
jgi:HSP20 family protein